jgi:phage terminase small subunit
VSKADDEEALKELLDVLTPKQRKWAEAYAGEARGNGTKAAEIAGYSGTREQLAVIAYNNVRNPKIRAVLDAWTESDPLVCGRVERMQILAAIARGEAYDEKLDGQGMRVEIRVATKDRLAALKALAEAAGEYIQRHEHKIEGDLERLGMKDLEAELNKLLKGGK